ncbi:MAG: elongation factor G [Planctomycetaceae bacterium]|jgi:elongation factor G|nr:elongation factor G [Planctomycetaceae bacterium]
MLNIKNLRNIGISAHIDSGKTTLSERILFYTGKSYKIGEVHEGSATMDHMELEQERGITITSAATTVEWNNNFINLIDTPGHVDFTVEVERSLRVLDGAVLVLCSVGGVQAQSITIDRQMKRYEVPRLALVNKMDRVGADPHRVVNQLNEKLSCGAILMQLPIGKEANFLGVIDLVENRAIYFDGAQGENVRIEAIPSELVKDADSARRKLLETLAMFSDEMMELLLEEKEPPVDLIHNVIRLAVWTRQLTPVFLATAYKNKGVQPLIDAIISYLPSPLDCDNYAWRSGYEKSNNTQDENNRLLLKPDLDSPAVAMAFKIVEDSYGTLVFMRIYQGTLKKGESYFNQRTGNKERISRIFRMHADSREEIESAGAGDIVAVIGVDCSSGDTFAFEKDYCMLESMYVPEPVIRIAIKAKATKDVDRLSKALYRFRKEDPTLSISTDPESGEVLMAGMGELHLDVYVERIRREYKVEVETSPPKVNYREAPTIPMEFDVKHKKQSGGSGQYAHIVGKMSPIPEDSDVPETFIFEEKIVGGTIPSNYIPAIEKGFRGSLLKGPVAGFPVVGLSVLVDDGSFHTVDSSDLAFRICAQTALRETFTKMKPTLLEPVMKIEIECPSQFQGNVVGDLNSRRGIINVTETLGAIARIEGEIPLAETFGYSTTLRSMTQGQGTFSMEFLKYKKVPNSIQEIIIKERKEAAAAGK